MPRSMKTEVPTAVSPSADTESAPPGDDQRWKMLTMHANEAFAAKRWREAEGLYLDALTEADAMFCTYKDGKPVGNADPVPMLVVATMNLAECWLRTGQPERAGDHLVALCHRLCAVVECEEARQDVREQCFFHLRPTVVELADKLPRAGWSQEQTRSEIQRAQDVALQFLAGNIPKRH